MQIEVDVKHTPFLHPKTSLLLENDLVIKICRKLSIHSTIICTFMYSGAIQLYWN